MKSSPTLHLFRIKYIRLVILETLLEIFKLISEIIFQTQLYILKSVVSIVPEIVVH